MSMAHWVLKIIKYYDSVSEFNAVIVMYVCIYFSTIVKQNFIKNN